jgi:peptidyl-tRNA hydrolase
MLETRHIASYKLAVDCLVSDRDMSLSTASSLTTVKTSIFISYEEESACVVPFNFVIISHKKVLLITSFYVLRHSFCVISTNERHGKP